MKIMLTKSLIIGFLLMGVIACNKDNNDDNYYVSLTTVVPLKVTGSNVPFYLIRDNGTELNPTKSDVPSYVAKENQRAFVWYNVLKENTEHKPNKEYDIHLLHIRNILTKSIIDLRASNADSIGNNPVRVLDIWSGGGFMNVKFAFYTDGMTTHYINLVKNTLIPPSTDGKIHLELRHNAHNAGQRELVYGFVCFNISQYKVADKQSVDFVITVKGFEETKTYTITYNFATGQEPNINIKNFEGGLSTEKFD